MHIKHYYYYVLCPINRGNRQPCFILPNKNKNKKMHCAFTVGCIELSDTLLREENLHFDYTEMRI